MWTLSSTYSLRKLTQKGTNYQSIPCLNTSFTPNSLHLFSYDEILIAAFIVRTPSAFALHHAGILILVHIHFTHVCLIILIRRIILAFFALCHHIHLIPCFSLIITYRPRFVNMGGSSFSTIIMLVWSSRKWIFWKKLLNRLVNEKSVKSIIWLWIWRTFV